MLDLRPGSMVVDGGQGLAIELGIADDDAVGSHECGARADQAAERISVGIELGAGGRLAVGQRFGGGDASG